MNILNEISASTQYGAPVFKIVNAVTGDVLTANDVGQTVGVTSDVGDDSQKWYFVFKKMFTLYKY